TSSQAPPAAIRMMMTGFIGFVRVTLPCRPDGLRANAADHAGKLDVVTLFSQPLESITEADLASLRENEVTEGRMIEFKAELPGGTDTEKLEFLADASSFPNAAGGDLIFGIRDEDGVAGGLQPIAANEVDAAILRLENLLRDTIEPRLTVRSRACVGR